MATIEVLYDDEHGTDLMIDNLHNVNVGWTRECLSCVTHTTRDGCPMEVQFHPTFRNYYIVVADPKREM